MPKPRGLSAPEEQGVLQNPFEQLAVQLEEWGRPYLSYSLYLTGPQLRLSDLFLAAPVRQVLRLLFDRNLTKYWLPVTAQWFLNMAKGLEFQALFGRFRQCPLSYRVLVESRQPRSPQFIIEDKAYLTLGQLKTLLVAPAKDSKQDLSAVLDDGLTSSLGKLSFEGLGPSPFFLWTFSYIQCDSPNRLNGAPGEQPDEAVQCFGKLKEQPGLLGGESLVYAVLHSRCEEVGNGFFAWKGEAEECKRHPQRFFLRRSFRGFALSAREKPPELVRRLEESDIIEVRDQSPEGKKVLKDALKRQGDFELERVEEELVL